MLNNLLDKENKIIKNTNKSNETYTSFDNKFEKSILDSIVIYDDISISQKNIYIKPDRQQFYKPNRYILEKMLISVIDKVMVDNEGRLYIPIENKDNDNKQLWITSTDNNLNYFILLPKITPKNIKNNAPGYINYINFPDVGEHILTFKYYGRDIFSKKTGVFLVDQIYHEKNTTACRALLIKISNL